MILLRTSLKESANNLFVGLSLDAQSMEAVTKYISLTFDAISNVESLDRVVNELSLAAREILDALQAPANENSQQSTDVDPSQPVYVAQPPQANGSSQQSVYTAYAASGGSGAYVSDNPPTSSAPSYGQSVTFVQPSGNGQPVMFVQPPSGNGQPVMFVQPP